MIQFLKLRKNFKAGAVIAGILLFMALLSLFWTPYDPEKMDAAHKLAGLSLAHPMGCDNFGRDILSRVMTGLRTTVVIAVGTVLIGAFFGSIVGSLTGYFGGSFDEIVMRINDVLLAFPAVLLALVMVSLLGGGKYNVILALGIAFVPSFARMVRGEFLRCKDLDYVKNARLQGAGHMRVIFVHILPNVMPVILSSVLIGFNNAVLAEAGMSYLGIGVQPPDASLGRMLSEAQGYLYGAPWYALFPGLILVLLILGVSLMGNE
ncbi:MAG: ABC transporter permease [Lachnospiraceae bacterium]|nr:ABC transporter permease [Lachnospiraceae bacterium]